jgi:hypothetical protein
MDPFTRPSGLSVVLEFLVLKDGSERDVERYSRSVSESESGLVRDPFPQGPAPATSQSNLPVLWREYGDLPVANFGPLRGG